MLNLTFFLCKYSADAYCKMQLSSLGKPWTEMACDCLCTPLHTTAVCVKLVWARTTKKKLPSPNVAK